MKILKLYLTALLGLNCLITLAQGNHSHSTDIINLENLVPTGKKESGTNEGGIYLDSSDSRWFIKKPTRSKALTSHEYIVGKLLSILKPEYFATITLVDNNPDMVASKFLEGFTPYRSHHVKHAGELSQRHSTTGIELLLVVRDWLGIEDENPGNIGTIPGEEGTLRFTRIDYDTAFYFNTYTLRPINLKTRGVTTLNDSALIEALGLIADMPDLILEETLAEIYFNIDEVGVNFDSEEREQLEHYLFARRQEFSLIREAFLANRDILAHLNEGDLEAAHIVYSTSEKKVQQLIQREWLLDHYTQTRGTYAKLTAIFPEVLKNIEFINDKNGYNPLHLAIEWEDLDLINLIIDSASDKHELIMAQDNRGWTSLHLAAYKGLTKCISLILEHSRIPLSIQAKGGETPLHLAAVRDRAEACTLLIDAGSEKEAPDTKGNTPLLLAAQEGSAETALLLIENNANLLHSNEEGETALHLSIKSNSKKSYIRLIDLEESLVIRQNKQGIAPLHTAVIEGNHYAIYKLIEKGANPCTEDHRGFSAIDLAIVLSLDVDIFDFSTLCLSHT